MVSSSNSLVIHNDILHTGSAKRNGASGVKGVDAAGILDTPIVMADLAAAIKNAASGLPVLDASSLLALAQQSINFKIGLSSIDTATASGTQAITGVGFSPRLVVVLINVASTPEVSIGWSRGASNLAVFNIHGATANAWNLTVSNAISLQQTGAIRYDGTIAMDADGFTITWTKTGAKTGTANFTYLALR